MPQLPRWAGCAVGAVAVALATLVRFALAATLGDTAPLLVYSVPVLAAAAVGGLRAGLVTTVLALAVGAVVFIPRAEWGNTDELVRFGLFLAVGGIISLMAGRMRALGTLSDAQRQALADAETYRGIVEEGAAYICRFRADGTLTFVNEAYCKCFGRTRAELLGSRFVPLVPEEDRPRVEGLFAALAGGAETYTHEHRVILPDGRVRWHRWANRVVRGASGGAEYQALGIDVTDRREVEEALRELTDTLEARVAARTAALAESERRFRAVFHSQFQFIGLMTTDGTLIEANRTALASAGVNEADVLNRPFCDTAWWAHDADLRERLKAAVARAAGGEQDRFEAHHPTADGGRIWVDFSLTPFRDETGRVRFLIPEGRDITDRKRADERLRESHVTLRALAQVQREFLVTANPRQSFDRLLAMLIELTGSAYGFVGEVFREPDGTPFLKTHAITNIAWDAATRAFYEQGAPTGLEFRNLDTLFGAVLRTGAPVVANDPAGDPRRGGLPPGHPELRAFLGLPFFHGDELIGTIGLANRPAGYDGELIGTLAPVLATCSSLVLAFRLERQRARAEAALRASEDRFRLATSAAGVGVWEWHLPTGRVHWNEQMFRMYAVAPTPDGTVTYRTWSGAVLPEDLPREEERLRATVGRRGSDERAFRIRLPDGTVRDIEAAETVLVDDRGAAEWVVGTNLDVTDRNRAAERLRASEERFRTFMDHLPLAAWATDERDRLVIANRFLARMLDRGPHELIGRTRTELLDAPSAAAHEANDRRVRATGAALELEETYQRPDGDTGYSLSVKFPVRGPDGTTLVGGVALDITDRKRAEAALRESEERFRRAFDNAPVGIALVAPNGRWLQVNRSTCAIFGRTEAELLATDFQTLTHPDDLAADLALARRVLAGELHTYQMEKRYFRKDGTTVYTLLSVSVVPDPSGRPLYFVSQIQDISERKRAETALRESEELYRSVVESLAEGVVVQDAAGTIVTCNEQACAALGLTRDQMTGRTSGDPRWRAVREDGTPLPGDEHPNALVLRTGAPVFGAVMGVHQPEGELRWLLVNAVPVRRTGDGSGPATVASFHDVTAARALDEKVRASLREKDLLLKEIHHRVKNNLQIVSALLDLQSGFTEDRGALAMFAESRGRVKSMALVHERLYKSHDVARVDFAEYARQLAADLFRAYRASDADVRLEVDVTAPPLPLDVAIPCGLLLNELMSNCFKHGLAGRTGTLRVALAAEADARELVVADDGPGLPRGSTSATPRRSGSNWCVHWSNSWAVQSGCAVPGPCSSSASAPR